MAQVAGHQSILPTVPFYLKTTFMQTKNKYANKLFIEFLEYSFLLSQTNYVLENSMRKRNSSPPIYGVWTQNLEPHPEIRKLLSHLTNESILYISAHGSLGAASLSGGKNLWDLFFQLPAIRITYRALGDFIINNLSKEQLIDLKNPNNNQYLTIRFTSCFSGRGKQPDGETYAGFFHNYLKETYAIYCTVIASTEIIKPCKDGSFKTRIHGYTDSFLSSYEAKKIYKRKQAASLVIYTLDENGNQIRVDGYRGGIWRAIVYDHLISFSELTNAKKEKKEINRLIDDLNSLLEDKISEKLKEVISNQENFYFVGQSTLEKIAELVKNQEILLQNTKNYNEKNHSHFEHHAKLDSAYIFSALGFIYIVASILLKTLHEKFINPTHSDTIDINKLFKLVYLIGLTISFYGSILILNSRNFLRRVLEFFFKPYPAEAIFCLSTIAINYCAIQTINNMHSINTLINGYFAANLLGALFDVLSIPFRSLGNTSEVLKVDVETYHNFFKTPKPHTQTQEHLTQILPK